MKIRADFVTNSSSSSYCTIRVNTDAGTAVNLSNVECRGFYTFWFHDPTARLANVKNIRDLLASIEYSVGGNSSNMDEKWLEKQLSVITDIASVTSVEISCHEEIADRDYSDPWPRDVRYSYSFGTGAKTVWSDTSWRSYRGYGDSLRPDFRSLDGEKLPFDFYEHAKGYLVVSCSSKAKEIVVPERILEDGKEKVVQGIGAKCFAGMKTLESLVLPRTAIYIAPDAFDGIKKTLKSIRVDGSDAGETTFVRDGSKLELTVSPEKELTIPDDVTELGESAFGGCLNLRTIHLHDGMKKPTMKALESCSGLTYVVLTDGSKINISKKDAMRCFTVKRGVIGFDYEKCEKYGIKQPGRTDLKQPELADAGSVLPSNGRGRSPKKLTAAELKRVWGVKKNGADTYEITSWKGKGPSVAVPDSIGSFRVTAIGDDAFSGAVSVSGVENRSERSDVLAEVVLPKGILSIGNGSFRLCTALRSISLPNGLRSIGVSPFGGCRSLREIDLPESVESIGERAFTGLNLSKLTIRTIGPISIADGNNGMVALKVEELRVSDNPACNALFDSYRYLVAKNVLFHKSMSAEQREKAISDITRIASRRGSQDSCLSIIFGEWDE